MTEQLDSDNSLTPQQHDADVLILIKKMQQQLASLEKKIDTLIGQSQEKPSGEKHFSKPFTPFDRPFRPGRFHDKRGRDEGPRERSFHSGSRFEKRNEGEGRGFGGPKRDYGGERENSFSHDRPFKKEFGGKKRGFAPRKKPFFSKRRD
jgi:hypothetical protein